MKVFPLVVLSFLLLLTTSKETLAAKKFVPRGSTTTQTKSSGSAGRFPSIVRYRPDHLGLLLSFSNFNGLDSVDYSFIYNTNGNAQGAGGTIRSVNNPALQRELLFGTCSTSVCTYHYNLSNARLVLTAHYSNGRVYTKSYRIKTYQ